MPPPYYPYSLDELPQTPDDPGLLRRLGHAAFTPLQWIGETLGKPAAAVRSALALPGAMFQGNGLRAARGLLNVLPFSDTLGITDPSENISGRDLLRTYLPESIISSKDTWGNFAAGLATEILTDPINYIAPFARTAAGKAVEQVTPLAGRTGEFIGSQAKLLPDAVQETIKTGNAITPELQTVLDAVKRNGATKAPRMLPDIPGVQAENLIQHLDDAPKPFSVTPTGVNELTITSDKGTQLLKTGQQASELYKTLGVHQPWFLPQSLVGDLGSAQFNLSDLPGVGQYVAKAGDMASKAADLLPAGVRDLPNSLMTKMRGLFDKASGDRADAPAQLLHREFKVPAFEDANLASQGVLQDIRKLAEPDIQAARSALGSGATKEQLWDAEQQVLRKIVGDAENLREYKLRQAAFDANPVGDAPPVPHPASLKIRDMMERKYDQLTSAGYDQAYLEDFLPRQMLGLEGPGQLPGETIADFAKRTGETKGRTTGIARKDFLKDIPGETGTLHDWSIDPELSGPNRTLDAAQAEEKIFQQLQSKWAERQALNDQLPALAAERMAVPTEEGMRNQASQVAAWLESLDPRHASEKIGFFGNDPFDKLGRYNFSVDQAAADAEMLQRGIAQGVRKDWAGQTVLGSDGLPRPVNKSDLVKVKDVLEQAGLRGPQAKENVARMLGVSAEDVDKLHLTQTNANWLLRRPQTFQTPDAVRPILNAFDNVTRLFKNWVTVPFPAKHMRDATYAAYGWMRDGGGENLDALKTAMKDAWKIVNGKADDALLETAKDAATRGVALDSGFGFTKELQPGIGLVKGERVTMPPAGLEGTTVAGEAKDFAQAFAHPSELLQKGRDFQRKMEDFYRLTHFLMKKNQGFSSEMAALHAKLYQMDFGNLTSFEKATMQRAFPFYNFAKQNLQGIAHDLVNQPALLANSIRVANSGRDENGYLPPWVGSGTAIPLPFGGDKRNYLTSLGLPFEDEGMMTAASLLSGHPGDAFRTALGQTVPQVKMPLELGFGKQIFTGRDLEDIKPSATASLGGLIPAPIARGITELAANSPAARLFSTADKVMDSNLPLPALAANLLTGMRVSQVDPQTALEMEAAKQVVAKLKSEGKAKEYETAYVPKGTNLNDEEQQMWQLYQLLQKRRQEAARQRRMG